MLLVCSRLRIMNDLVHGLRMVELILGRKMQWRLMDLILLIVVPNIAGFLAGGDVLFEARHAWSRACGILTCGAPRFSLCLVLSKMGVQEGECRTYLIFLVLRGRVEIRQRPSSSLANPADMVQGQLH